MKRLAFALLFALAAPLCHAEDIAPALRSCSGFARPSEFIHDTAARLTPKVIDLSYFPPRRGLRFDGLPVVAVFGFDFDRTLFARGPGTAPPVMYGVTVEGTEAAGQSLVSGSSAQSEASGLRVANHEFIDIFCYVR